MVGFLNKHEPGFTYAFHAFCSSVCVFILSSAWAAAETLVAFLLFAAGLLPLLGMLLLSSQGILNRWMLAGLAGILAGLAACQISIVAWPLI